MRVSVALLLCTLVPVSIVGSEEPGFSLIVSRSNPVSSMRRPDLARIFLKKSRRWSDGRDVMPIDQSLRSPVRTAFTRSVLAAEGMSQTSAVESYWLQQVYSGGGNPPAIKPSDAEVIAFVAANQDAIGYVSRTVDVSSVKVLTIEQ